MDNADNIDQDDAPRGRGGSTRVSRRQLYCHWMQVCWCFFIVRNDFSLFLYPRKFLSFFYLIRSC